MAGSDKPGSTAGDALSADDAKRRSRSQAGPEAGGPAKPGADSPKPHGDKLGLGGKAEAASPEAMPGDSSKPHGDPLRNKL